MRTRWTVKELANLQAIIAPYVGADGVVEWKRCLQSQEVNQFMTDTGRTPRGVMSTYWIRFQRGKGIIPNRHRHTRSAPTPAPQAQPQHNGITIKFCPCCGFNLGLIKS